MYGYNSLHPANYTTHVHRQQKRQPQKCTGLIYYTLVIATYNSRYTSPSRTITGYVLTRNVSGAVKHVPVVTS